MHFYGGGSQKSCPGMWVHLPKNTPAHLQLFGAPDCLSQLYSNAILCILVKYSGYHVLSYDRFLVRKPNECSAIQCVRGVKSYMPVKRFIHNGNLSKCLTHVFRLRYQRAFRLHMKWHLFGKCSETYTALVWWIMSFLPLIHLSGIGWGLCLVGEF